ncbi:MAG: archaetidylserine decarboxylase [Wenzhouxiangella sp.]|jgi:phosphatidylserine decarboxylase|nr:archaetidylserine decarboxylase [Wenzhouxiangella sp.]
MSLSLADRIAVWPQYLLPQKLLTAAANKISNARHPWVRRPLIGAFRRLFPVKLSEAAKPDPSQYDSFNAFFTRALRNDARPLAPAGHRLISPCDGTLSQLGRISGDQLVQAKGVLYSAADLLGSQEWAGRFADGRFMTIYLAPYDYHRVHAPMAGRPVEESRIPGELFSVSTRTARAVPGLFARNERMSVILETEYGPVAVVMVAAMLVAGIETVWRPGGPYRPEETLIREPLDTAPLKRGQELGRFHWGSTVILLTPTGFPDWLPTLMPGQIMRLGQALTAEEPDIV